ncbi:MAG: hypothetical protein K0R92_1254, partial [Lachnospiraceae bacterium]|nr:hypothetical protein [Lachnospiraceae bacterium]
AYMFVYGRVDFVKLSGTADYIRLKYIYTWGFFYLVSNLHRKVKISGKKTHRKEGE